MFSTRILTAATILVSLLCGCPSPASAEENTSGDSVLQKELQTATATRSNDPNVTRRYYCFNLIQNKRPQEALDQLKTIRDPMGIDLYLKAMASEQLGEPGQAADMYKQAVEKEPKNDLFRTKAIQAMIIMSRYQDAANLCSEGKTQSETKRSYYESEQKRMEAMAAMIAKNRPCVHHKH